MYEKLGTATQYIHSIKKIMPKVGIVLGSGLGIFVKSITDATIIPYGDIPYFKNTSVEGHEGRLILGKVNGVDVAVLQGRLHAYEGHSMEDIVFPVRVLATLGVEAIILTNAAGGINFKFSTGDLILIEDHINLMNSNPLVGPNIADLGPRFPDMTMAYNENLKQCFLEAAQEINYPLKKGIYCSLLGPTYETPAEVRMLRILGADMVGMSTVPESIAANHLGIKVAGLSCITNMAAGINHKKLKHEDIKDEAQRVVETFSNLLTLAIGKIGNMENSNLN